MIEDPPDVEKRVEKQPTFAEWCLGLAFVMDLIDSDPLQRQQYALDWFDTCNPRNPVIEDPPDVEQESVPCGMR